VIFLCGTWLTSLWGDLNKHNLQGDYARIANLEAWMKSLVYSIGDPDSGMFEEQTSSYSGFLLVSTNLQMFYKISISIHAKIKFTIEMVCM
jgi:hypothetical protein